jgi:gluconolactonase
VIWCAGQDLALMRLEKDGTRTVLAKGFEGKHFNGPNDVAIARDGSIYFTDSDVGLRGGIHSPLVQMPDSVWRWKDGEVVQAVSREQLGAEPNGIALSPDDRYLYLSAGTASADPKMMRYPIHADGSVGPGEVFSHGRGIGDGMKADRFGNIYSTDGPRPQAGGALKVAARGLLQDRDRCTHCRRMPAPVLIPMRIRAAGRLERAVVRH